MLIRLLFILLLAGSVQAAFPTDWGRSVRILIESDSIDANLSNFPTLLTEDNFPSEAMGAAGSNQALEGGGDVRFSADSAGTERLACDIVLWDSVNSACEVWVKIPTMSSTTDTAVWAWYHKSGETQPAEDAAYGREATWESNYKLVWHLQEDPSGTMNDATSSDNNATTGGGDPSSSTGAIGNAVAFDGTDDRIGSAQSASLHETGDMSWSGWMKWGSSQAIYDMPFSIETDVGEDEDENSILYFWVDGESTEWDIMYCHEYSTGTNETNLFNTNIADDTWTHIAVTRDVTNDEVILWKDGTLIDTYNYSNDPTNTGSTCWATGGTRTNGASDWTGELDEIRFATTEWSAGWVTTEYSNQNTPEHFAYEGTPYTPEAGEEEVGAIIIVN